MPLIKSKSKKAFEKNVETEMNEGKPQNQSLAIAFSVKRKAKKKKMAEGGSVRSGKTRHQNEKGVHSESFSYDKPGKSDSGVYIRSHGSTSDKSKELLRAEHEDIMNQQSKIKPKLKGLASGGEITPIQGPRMTASSIIKPKSRDEVDAEMMAKGGMANEEELYHNPAGGSANRPKNVARMRNEEHQRGVGKGGTYDPGQSKAGYSARASHSSNPDITSRKPFTDEMQTVTPKDFSSQAKREHEQVRSEASKIHPKLKGLASGGSVESGSEDMNYADGGEIDDSLSHEEDEEHHNSIAAAIMAKRHREAQDSDSDIDTQMMMAEGGDVESDVVDLMENGEEQPNEFYHLNEHEALDHNFNEPLEDIHQPTDSNLTGDSAEDEAENEHDMISSIRRKMSMRRQFGK